jgi:hypothetical protein
VTPARRVAGRRISTGALVAIDAVLAIATAYFSLAVTTGCEDYNPGGCHRSYQWLCLITLAAALVILLVLLLRAVSRVRG